MGKMFWCGAAGGDQEPGPEEHRGAADGGAERDQAEQSGCTWREHYRRDAAAPGASNRSAAIRPHRT